MSQEPPTPKTTSIQFPRLRITTASLLAFGILAAASWGYILGTGDSGVAELFRGDTWRGVGHFLGRLAGVGSDSTPAFITAEAWKRGGLQAIETLAMSVLAIGIAGAAVLLTFLPAARNVAFGELSGSGSWVGKPAYFVLRGAFAFTRGVPELLWAMIIVFMLSPGILPGAIALAVHNYGIVGKLGAEVVENLDPRPARALKASGANGFQMLGYGILPQALPQLLTFLLYRWEVVIRTTIVVGFVAAGGLGREFQLRMSWFQYDEVALLLVYYLLLVILVDVVAAGLRRLAR